jgi:hypothetical protein
VDDFGLVAEVLDAEVPNAVERAPINDVHRESIPIPSLGEAHDQPAHRVAPHRVVPAEQDTWNRHTIPGPPRTRCHKADSTVADMPVGARKPGSLGEQGLRSIRRCCSCSRSSSARSPACWPCRMPMTPVRIWRSWCSGINSACYAAIPAVPGSPPSTVSCSPPPADSCPGTDGQQ